MNEKEVLIVVELLKIALTLVGDNTTLRSILQLTLNVVSMSRGEQ